MTIEITNQTINVVFKSATFIIEGSPTTNWGQINGTLSNQTDLQNALNAKADSTSLSAKINVNNGNFTGTLASNTTAKIEMAGDASGNNAQQFPVSRSTPYLNMSTFQVSEYDGNDPTFGGYSELIRLKYSQRKAKPTIAFYDHEDKPVFWFVAHDWAQNLRIFPTFADFPATGVNDNLTAYLDESTGNGYYWNGSAYILLVDSDERWWYMWHHLHASMESADSTGYSNYTRFGIRHGFNVVDVEVVNAHFRVKDGSHKSTNYGAFILDSGRTYADNSFIFYPNATIRTNMLNKNDNVNNIFNSNAGGFRLEKLGVGASGNPTGQQVILVGTDSATYEIVENRKTTATARQGIYNNPYIVEYPSADAFIHFSRGTGTLEDSNRRWSIGQLTNDGFGIVRRNASGSFVSTPFFVEFATGRIGVNTTSPSSVLHVVGTSTLAGQVKGVLAPTDSTDATNKTYVDTKTSVYTSDDQGFIAWAYDINSAVNPQTGTIAGTVYTSRVPIRHATTITKLYFAIANTPAGLANCYMALYQSGSLLAQSADVSADWTTAGMKEATITATAVSAGYIDVAFWFGSASTAPQFLRGANQVAVNGNLTGLAIRGATGATGITTTAPATITKTATNSIPWVAVA